MAVSSNADYMQDVLKSIIRDRVQELEDERKLYARLLSGEPVEFVWIEDELG